MKSLKCNRADFVHACLGALTIASRVWPMSAYLHLARRRFVLALKLIVRESQSFHSVSSFLWSGMEHVQWDHSERDGWANQRRGTSRALEHGLLLQKNARAPRNHFPSVRFFRANPFWERTCSEACVQNSLEQLSIGEHIGQLVEKEHNAPKCERIKKMESFTGKIDAQRLAKLERRLVEESWKGSEFFISSYFALSRIFKFFKTQRAKIASGYRKIWHKKQFWKYFQASFDSKLVNFQIFYGPAFNIFNCRLITVNLVFRHTMGVIDFQTRKDVRCFLSDPLNFRAKRKFLYLQARKVHPKFLNEPKSGLIWNHFKAWSGAFEPHKPNFFICFDWFATFFEISTLTDFQICVRSDFIKFLIIWENDIFPNPETAFKRVYFKRATYSYCLNYSDGECSDASTAGVQCWNEQLWVGQQPDRWISDWRHKRAKNQVCR